ncbi:copper resistance protein CopC [Escherichia coli]
MTAAPQQITLNFSEGVETGSVAHYAETKILKHYRRSEMKQDQVIPHPVPLADSLKPGTYIVDWHVVSVDGHKTKGHYTFSVK